MWAALNSSDCCLFLKNKIIHALQAAVGAVASYIRTHISLHWHCISCDESRGVLAIWYPIEILSLKNYTIIDLGSIGYFTEHWYRLSIQLKLSYWNYFGIDFHTRIYSTSIGFAPFVVTPLHGHPARQLVNKTEPNQMRPKAKPRNWTKANQTKANPTAAATTTCTSTRVDPNQIPNLILCLCHHSSSAQRSVSVGGGGGVEVGVAPFGSPNS